MTSLFAQIKDLDAFREACGKPIIGLLGAIGSGKSAVAACLRRLGCGVIDADAINAELLREDPVQREILAAFGPQVAGADGRLDTRRLTEHVFADPRRLRRLTDLLHPRIQGRMAAMAAAFECDPAVAAIVLDAPLLMEVGLHTICTALVYVHADRAQRLGRLGASRGWDAREVARREKFLFSLDKKRRMSDYTVDNSH